MMYQGVFLKREHSFFYAGMFGNSLKQFVHIGV